MHFFKIHWRYHRRRKYGGSSPNSLRPISYFGSIWGVYVLDLKTKVFCRKQNQLHFPMNKGLTVTVPKQCLQFGQKYPKWLLKFQPNLSAQTQKFRFFEKNSLWVSIVHDRIYQPVHKSIIILKTNKMRLHKEISLILCMQLCAQLSKKGSLSSCFFALIVRSKQRSKGVGKNLLNLKSPKMFSIQFRNYVQQKNRSIN